MRVRERGYIIGVGVLDEADVLKAVGSVRRMSAGIELEERVGVEGRRWSIRDEIVGRVEEAGEREGEGDGLPPLPECLELLPSPTTPASPFTPPPTRVSLLPRSELMVPSHDALVEASRTATNETKKRRRELERKEEEVKVVRARYEEAKDLAERLRVEVKRGMPVGRKGRGGWGFEGEA